jgi:hypothetical protein
MKRRITLGSGTTAMFVVGPLATGAMAQDASLGKVVSAVNSVWIVVATERGLSRQGEPLLFVVPMGRAGSEAREAQFVAEGLVCPAVDASPLQLIESFGDVGVGSKGCEVSVKKCVVHSVTESFSKLCCTTHLDVPVI